MNNMSASFYTAIGFATKLNYQAFIDKYPEDGATLQAIIDKHYLTMKNECAAFVKTQKTKIYMVEEQRKEEYRRAKVQADQAKLEMQKTLWLKQQHENSINSQTPSGLTQLTAITLDTLDDETVISISDEMQTLKLGYEERIKEMKGYTLFLESKCKELGEKCFELEKANFALTELNKELKTQLNSEIVGEKRRRQ
jgi:hypothetical protein